MIVYQPLSLIGTIQNALVRIFQNTMLLKLQLIVSIAEMMKNYNQVF